ncbi:hypothetical protein H2203_000545 [Taxawa tesnikishii (nom. ined.)]|nr:hypothetical protein H2203_000545 [Dothideales sp. JES 119]
MAGVSVASTALLVLVALIVYRFMIYPAFVSPLSKIPPAHHTAAISPAWILWKRYSGNENVTVHAAHARFGPLVRLGPSEISVNCVDGGIRTVYGGGYEKGDWYSKMFANYGYHNMFSTAERGPHSVRKRMLSNIYAKSTLQSSPALAQISSIILLDRMLPRIGKGQKIVLEAYELFSAVTMDFVTAYQFGLPQGSNFTQDEKHCREFLLDYKARQQYTFWPQEVPNLTAFARRVGLGHLLVPKWVDQANRDIEDWCLSMCDAAENALESGTTSTPGDVPSVYGQMRTALMKEQMKQDSASVEKQGPALTEEQRLSIASEMLDQLAAGFDTSGITLTYLAWELSKPHNSNLQEALRHELQFLDPPIRLTTASEKKSTLPDPKDIDALPLLHAVLMETLRLHAAIPGGQPRVTPANASLGPPDNAIHGIPAGIRVNSAAFSLHRNPDVFAEPEQWRPERWLDAEGAVDSGGEKGRWFWAFGSGGRMCVGSNLAMVEMKNIVAALWSNYRTAIVDDKGMVHNGGYLAEPLGSPEGNYLLLRCECLPITSES